MDRKEKLQQLLAQLSGSMEALTAAAEAENRPLNDDEQGKFDQFSADFAKTEQEIANLERVEQTKTKVSQPNPRVVQPMDYTGTTSGTPAPQPGRPSVTGNVVAHSYANHGFTKGKGEFMMAVRDARIYGKTDPRLLVNSVSTFGGIDVGADGGYLLPPQFAQEVWSAVLPQESFVNALGPIQTNSNLLTIPADEDPPWGTSGITAAKTAEGAAITQSKAVFKKVNVPIYTVAALVSVSEQSLSDVPFLASFVQSKMAEKLRWYIENKVINGTGTDEPLGFLSAPGLLTYSDAGSTATTFGAVDIYAMQALGLPGSGGFWVAHPSTFAALATINTGSGGVALMNPDLSAAPKRTLSGEPLYLSEACKALDTAGDIFYVKPAGYTLAFNGSVQTANTIAFAFDQMLSSFRASIRMGGAPMLSAKVTRAVGGSNYASHIINMAGSRS